MANMPSFSLVLHAILRRSGRVTPACLTILACNHAVWGCDVHIGDMRRGGKHAPLMTYHADVLEWNEKTGGYGLIDFRKECDRSNYRAMHTDLECGKKPVSQVAVDSST